MLAHTSRSTLAGDCCAAELIFMPNKQSVCSLAKLIEPTESDRGKHGDDEVEADQVHPPYILQFESRARRKISRANEVSLTLRIQR